MRSTDDQQTGIALLRDLRHAVDGAEPDEDLDPAAGVDEMVISLVARGMGTGDVQAHLGGVYGTNVSRQQISDITDAAVEKTAEWANRPLDRVYPVIFIVAINVKIRDGQVANRPIYVALAVTCEGERDILSRSWRSTGRSGP